MSFVARHRKIAEENRAEDFTPVSLVVASPYGVTVNPSLGVKTLSELIALARAKPGFLNLGSSSNGTFLGGALLFDMAGAKANNVSYKGGASTLIALLSGEITVSLTSLTAALPHVKTGKLRVLAVTNTEAIAGCARYSDRRGGRATRL